MKKQILKAISLIMAVSMLCACATQEDISSVPETNGINESSSVEETNSEEMTSRPESSVNETSSQQESKTETSAPETEETSKTEATTTTTKAPVTEVTPKPETTTAATTKKPETVSTPKPETTTSNTTTPVTETTPNKEVLLDVIAEGQGTLFESGSGVMAASMVLKYYGVDVNIDELYNCLDMVDVNREDVTPWEYCMGTPKTMDALYYAPVVKNMINTYLNKKGISNLKAIDKTGCTPNDIYNSVLNGNPVIVVANKIMRNYTENGVSWVLPNGEEFIWKVGAVYWVVIGVNSSEVKVINAKTGIERSVKKVKFEDSFKLYDSQAIIIE